MLSKFENQKIEESIAGIYSVAENLPGVVIIHDMRDWSVVWMSKRGLQELGISLDEVKNLTAEEYYGRYFNAEDTQDYVPRVFDLIQRNNDEETVTYFQQVKFNEADGFHWHMSSTKIFMRDNEGKPLLIITMSFPIDPKHHLSTKAGRLLEENNFLRKNLKLYAKLSPREQEVLRLLALGKSAVDTASELFISLNTVETHRKNIKIKLETTSYFELCQFARVFDLI